MIGLVLAASACRQGSARDGGAGERSRDPVDPELSHAAAEELARIFTRAGTHAEVSDATVRTARHSIVARVTVGQVTVEADRAIAAIQVHLEVDGQRNDIFRVAAVGIDLNRREAIHHALREWSVAYAIAIVDALRTSEPEQLAAGGAHAVDGGLGRAPPIAFGPYLAFPGPTGVRGQPPPDWQRGTPEMHRDFLRRFEASIDALIPAPRRPGYHTFKLTLHVRNGAAGEGECLVDGAPSARLCDLAREYPWPSGPFEFLFKQFYVLAERPGERLGPWRP